MSRENSFLPKNKQQSKNPKTKQNIKIKNKRIKTKIKQKQNIQNKINNNQIGNSIIALLSFFSDSVGRRPLLALFFRDDGCSCWSWLGNEEGRNMFAYNNLYDIYNSNIYHIRHLTSAGVLLLVARSLILFGNS